MSLKARKTAFAAVMVGLLTLVCCRHVRNETPLKTTVELQAHIAELERTIPTLMGTAGVPGMSIALIRDGEVVWSRGFGIKNAKTGEPVGEHTVFEAASLTKPFFAYLVMKFVEDGKLNLDRPLITYAPEDYIVKTFVRHPLDKEGFRRDRFNKITARMVLSHSSGLPHGEPRNPLPIFFEPGERYRYSADGYEYLQRIVEHLAGEPLHEIMRKMVIEPLQMNDSSMVWRESYETQAAVGHDMLAGTRGEFRKRTEAHAAASLYTTAADYARFVAALMNGRGLKKRTIEKMLSPQIGVEKNVSWSLGFGLERTPNGKAFWQWGDYGIFRNYVVAYPEKKIGVVYLTNSQNGLSIGQDVLDVAIGGSKDSGLTHLNYDRYDSPSMTLARAIQTGGVDEAVRIFQESRAKDPTAFKERDLNGLGYTLMNGGRAREAVEILKVNAQAFPDSANVYDSLAEASMKNGDEEQAVLLYKKAIETAPRDRQADKAFLESLVAGAREKVDKLEKRMSRRLGSEEAEKRYSRFTGNWQFDVPGYGVMNIKVFVADGLLWGSVEGGVLGERAEFIPVEGKALDFKVDSPEQGLFDWEFVENDQGAIVKSQFYLQSANLKAEGFRKL
jgi:CubicO group peptidase (beta-lactamase class C family)